MNGGNFNEKINFITILALLFMLTGCTKNNSNLQALSVMENNAIITETVHPTAAPTEAHSEMSLP